MCLYLCECTYINRFDVCLFKDVCGQLYRAAISKALLTLDTWPYKLSIFASRSTGVVILWPRLNVFARSREDPSRCSSSSSSSPSSPSSSSSSSSSYHLLLLLYVHGLPIVPALSLSVCLRTAFKS